MRQDHHFAYFGSPLFSKIVLEALLDSGHVPNVLVCNPDKEVGRKKILTSPLTKQLVQEKGLNTRIIQPAIKAKLSEYVDVFSDCDYAIIAAYSKIIPESVLKCFSKGVIGVHPSLLPLYRGPSPIQSAILNGEKKTGITLFLTDKETDHGDIIAQETISLTGEENYLELEERLARSAGVLLAKKLPLFLTERMPPISQDHSKATFTKKFETKDGFLDLNKDSPEKISATIRALTPEPGAFAMIEGKRTKLNKINKDGHHWIITNITPDGRPPRNVHIVVG